MAAPLTKDSKQYQEALKIGLDLYKERDWA